MPYVRRNVEGRVESLHRNATPEASEFLDDDHVEVRAFIGLESPPDSDFGRLDADFVRVIEDVIDALIVRNVINITDMPEQAQAKLFARKSARQRLGRSSLRLFGDSSFTEVINDSKLGDLN